MWIFKVKENLDWSINKYKARLVAKRFHQQHDFEFHETLSHVVKMTTVQIVLDLAIIYKWEVQQINISNAFLNGDL